MPSTLERLSPTRVKLTLTIPHDVLKPAVTKAYCEIASQISIPGFRKGKVPPALIDQRIGRQAVLGEAANAVMPDAYAAAVMEHGLAPLSNPEIEAVTLEPDQDAVFTAELDVRPDFDLPAIADLTVEVRAVAVDDSDVDAELERLRQRLAETRPVEREARLGDQVTIDLIGTKDGVLLPDAAADGVPHVIGDDDMVEGLDEAITGLKAGESAVFSSRLLSRDSEGVEADISVTVTAVAERLLPDLDDDFADLYTSVDTLAEFREQLRRETEQRRREFQLREARIKLADAVIAATPFDLPQGLLDREVEERTQTLTETLERAGLTLEEYLKATGQEETADEYWAGLAKATERSLRSEILFEKAADDWGIKVSTADFAAFIMRRAEDNGTTPEQELQHMREHDHTSAWLTEIRREKALDEALTRATVTDSAGQPVDVAYWLAQLNPPLPTEAVVEEEPGDGIELIDIT